MGGQYGEKEICLYIRAVLPGKNFQKLIQLTENVYSQN